MNSCLNITSNCCPSCGAPRTTFSNKCEYCGTILTPLNYLVKDIIYPSTGQEIIAEIKMPRQKYFSVSEQKEKYIREILAERLAEYLMEYKDKLVIVEKCDMDNWFDDTITYRSKIKIEF